ncbi:MAG TPA: EAL domain-containing response regulator [Usitatibacter sp.]|nr:EAL domain-containing response regulator [Usitatibacter sp.]
MPETNDTDRGTPRLAAAATPIAELRFLVVEDQGFQRWAMASMLRSLGAQYVFNAADGHAALEIFRGLDRPIDVIVSDLDMPGMDGMELIRHVAQARMPVSVILASALAPSVLASVESMARAYGIDVLGAIEKPATVRKLEKLIARRSVRPLPGHNPRLVFTLEEMVAGLENDEFEPFFQPQVELASGRVRGVEALARWRHPKSGLVPPHIPPYLFIEPLEDNGYIDRLTWIMLDKAAAQCGTWRRAGLDATVSVNVSLASFADVAVAARVAHIVEENGLEPRHVVIEVTESAKPKFPGPALESLSRLRMKGFGIAIDDYGTGHSSLQQLARVAFSELKIDQSFVRDAATHVPSRVIVESTLEMARRLGMAAVAEGVETQDDWDLLRRLGCEAAQGYFIAMPMPGDAFLDWAKDWR